MDKQLIKDTFKVLKEYLGNVWLSSYGTSIQTYDEDYDKILNYFKKNKIYDLSKNSIFFKKIDEILPINKKRDERTPGLARISQRINYWTLMGYLIKHNKNNYELKERTNIPHNDLFIIQGFNLLKHKKEHINDKSYDTAIRIFNGFLVYLIYIFDKASLLEILDEYKQNDPKNGLIDKLTLKESSKIEPIANGTYNDFFKKHFVDFDEKNLEEILFEIKNKTFNWISNNSNEGQIYENNKLVDNFLDVITQEIKNIDNPTPSTKKQIINKIIRKGFHSAVILACNNTSSLIVNDIEVNKNYIGLCEAAHIIPVSDISDLILEIENNNKTEEDNKELLCRLLREQNGILIPFNYHKLFDNKKILIDHQQKKFIINEELELEEKELIKNVYGFSENNKFKEKKFDEIKKIIEDYNSYLKSK